MCVAQKNQIFKSVNSNFNVYSNISQIFLINLLNFMNNIIDGFFYVACIDDCNSFNFVRYSLNSDDFL